MPPGDLARRRQCEGLEISLPVAVLLLTVFSLRLDGEARLLEPDTPVIREEGEPQKTGFHATTRFLRGGAELALVLGSPVTDLPQPIMETVTTSPRIPLTNMKRLVPPTLWGTPRPEAITPSLGNTACGPTPLDTPVSGGTEIEGLQGVAAVLL